MDFLNRTAFPPLQRDNRELAFLPLEEDPLPPLSTLAPAQTQLPFLRTDSKPPLRPLSDLAGRKCRKDEVGSRLVWFGWFGLVGFSFD
jgi:hypothetical protein